MKKAICKFCGKDNSILFNCKYSKLGLKIVGRNIQREGVIVGESNNKSCWRVKWNGIKYVSSYHKTFIKKIK